MLLITSVCSGGMAFHGLSFVHSICRPPSLLTSIKALTVAFPTINPRHRLLRRSPFDSAIRALASAAVSTASPVSQEGKVSAKAQWKAAIDFKWIRDNKDVIAANIMNRNSNANLNVVLDLYEKFLNLQKEVERLRAERNIVAEKMRGKIEASVRQALVQEGKNLKEKLASLEEDLVHLTDQLQQEAQCIPNITHPNVPIGGEESSVIRKMVGSPREFTFNIKDHLELGKELDLFDFDAAAEILEQTKERERKECRCPSCKRYFKCIGWIVDGGEDDEVELSSMITWQMVDEATGADENLQLEETLE